ncbi:hypothetical protein J2Z69_000118 [Paenibacillus shirakamiensis]|uniref:Uncharacterized protein n=1 Tax=Paenibacillus shirakamiensis TaxID=1265935 RepID=A0ABS4JBK9_9BACL|nr:hypothetical protein [Paenibacillus shirakamiensis]
MSKLDIFLLCKIGIRMKIRFIILFYMIEFIKIVYLKHTLL